eukprot:766428-Hanusia_phi.AAC.2
MNQKVADLQDAVRSAQSEALQYQELADALRTEVQYVNQEKQGFPERLRKTQCMNENHYDNLILAKRSKFR